MELQDLVNIIRSSCGLFVLFFCSTDGLFLRVNGNGIRHPKRKTSIKSSTSKTKAAHKHWCTMKDCVAAAVYDSLWSLCAIFQNTVSFWLSMHAKKREEIISLSFDRNRFRIENEKERDSSNGMQIRFLRSSRSLKMHRQRTDLALFHYLCAQIYFFLV